MNNCAFCAKLHLSRPRETGNETHLGGDCTLFRRWAQTHYGQTRAPFSTLCTKPNALFHPGCVSGIVQPQSRIQRKIAHCTCIGDNFAPEMLGAWPSGDNLAAQATNYPGRQAFWSILGHNLLSMALQATIWGTHPFHLPVCPQRDTLTGLDKSRDFMYYSPIEMYLLKT